MRGVKQAQPRFNVFFNSIKLRPSVCEVMVYLSNHTLMCHLQQMGSLPLGLIHRDPLVCRRAERG
jgi:hypothetical protein